MFKLPNFGYEFYSRILDTRVVVFLSAKVVEKKCGALNQKLRNFYGSVWSLFFKGKL
jgi:hypothetical protein